MTTIEPAVPVEPPAAPRAARPHGQRAWYLAAVLSLACLPSLLVFFDRWVGSGLLSDLTTPIRCRWSLSCLGPWPAAAVLIVIASLATVVLVARRPSSRRLLESHPQGETIAEPRPALRQRRLATVALALTILAMVSVLAARAANGSRPEWDYALPFLGFLAAVTLYEVPIKRAFFAMAAAGRGWALPIAVHLLLVLTLWASVDRRSWAPALAVLSVAAHVILWRTRRGTLTLAFWLVSLNLVVTSFYLLGWWFSAIGDEYAFYEFAARLLRDPTFTSAGGQLYNPAAVYAAHPGCSSLIQVASMALFGPGLFGWRFSSLYLAALSLWPFYVFVDAIGGRRLATLSGALLASSHYLMSFGKIGYNNLQALFAFSLGLAAATWFIRSSSRRAAAALGAALGLAFFVYPGALLTVPVIVLFAVQPPITRAAARRWLLVGFTLLATTAPILLQRGFWETKLAGTMWQDPSAIGEGVSASTYLLRNLGQASISFLLTPAESHFVAVGLVDIVTAVLVIVGFGALLRSGDRQSRGFLLSSLAILLILVGALHGYSSPPLTRMFLLLPWLAILGGLGLLWLESALRDLGASERAVHRVTVALLGLILAVNFVQAYPLARLRMAIQYQSPQVLLLREADTLLDPGPTHARLLILTLPEDPLRDSVARMLRLHHVRFDENSLVEEGALEVTEVDLSDSRTMVLIAPRVPDPLHSELEARLQAAGKTACSFRSSIGQVRLVVWVAPPERYRCAEAPYRW